jgi:hypothetical protein
VPPVGTLLVRPQAPGPPTGLHQRVCWREEKAGMTWLLPCAEGSLRASCQPTSPPRPSTTLSNPQGASLGGPAASSNSSYVPCYPLLCESRLSTPARHIRSYPFWVNASSVPQRYATLTSAPWLTYSGLSDLVQVVGFRGFCHEMFLAGLIPVSIRFRKGKGAGQKQTGHFLHEVAEIWLLATFCTCCT